MACVRIAMWSGPRNISTAMMRAFENRPDCAVVDEPFYAAYLAATGLEHPAREAVLNSQPRDWRVVAAALECDEPAPVYYQKHMCQHLLADMSLAFTERLTNCFLIRDPRRIVASYARVRPTFTLEELGFPQQLALFEREAQRLGEAPPVLDAALTLADPPRILRGLCERVGIPFDDAMLAWPSGPRVSDGVWAPHWYASVRASTGFRSPAGEADGGLGAGDEKSSGGPPQLTQAQEALSLEAAEIYARMRPFALGALPDGDKTPPVGP